MSEAGNATASQPANTAAQPVNQSAPVQPQAPAIDPGEYAQYRRDSQHLAGMKKQLAELGFSDPSKLAAYKPVFEKIKDPARFAQAWDNEPEQQPQPLDERKFMELLDKREQAKALADAEKSHYSTLDADEANFADDKVDAILGADAPKELKALVKSAMIGDYHRSRQSYEEGHPLHGKLAKPLGNEWFGKQAQTYKGHFDALKKHFQGQHLAAVGSAATQAQPSGAPAGGQPGGKADKRGENKADYMRDSVIHAAASAGLA